MMLTATGCLISGMVIATMARKQLSRYNWHDVLRQYPAAAIRCSHILKAGYNSIAQPQVSGLGYLADQRKYWRIVTCRGGDYSLLTMIRNNNIQKVV